MQFANDFHCKPSSPRIKTGTITVMLARINFLFSTSLVILLLFYFGGRYVFLRVISGLAPGLVPYFIGAYILAALMLTVLAVAKVVIRLGAVSSVARAQRPTLNGYGAQVLFCLAHLSVICAITTRIPQGSEQIIWWPWFAAPALYSGGIYMFVIDIRQRALRPLR
jgi:hypothetical protein